MIFCSFRLAHCRSVALKVPLFSADDGPDVLERFYREARAAATVRHPNVCPLFDIGELNGVPYLTMAFIEGKPLGDFVASQPITARQAAVLIRKLALALQEAHKVGVIHRDLKPGNIIIDRRGEPLIMDFGLARRSEKKEARLTQEGMTLGTPSYMPPEQVSGKLDAMGPASDIYSLGVIFYELLAGRLPFEGDVMQVLAQVLMDEPPPPSKFTPSLDPQLEAICLKAMAKTPSDRYASMSEFAVALQDYLRGNSPPTAQSGSDTKKDPQSTPEGAKQPSDLRVSAMGGLQSMARFPVRTAEALDAGRPSRKRRRVRPQARVPIWLFIAAGGVLVLIVGLWAGGAFRSKTSRETNVAKSEPPRSPASSLPAKTEKPPVDSPNTRTSPAEMSNPSKPVNATPAPSEPVFASLFNSRDLDGWFVERGSGDQWKIEEGGDHTGDRTASDIP